MKGVEQERAYALQCLIYLFLACVHSKSVNQVLASGWLLVYTEPERNDIIQGLKRRLQELDLKECAACLSGLHV